MPCYECKSKIGVTNTIEKIIKVDKGGQCHERVKKIRKKANNDKRNYVT